MIRNLSLVYLTEQHYKKLKKYFPEDKHLKKELSANGYKFGVFVDGKLIFCLIVCYGNNPKSAYIAQLYTDGTMESKKILISFKKMFDELHKDWFVVFTSKDVASLFRHSKEIKMCIYQYTGCLS